TLLTADPTLWAALYEKVLALESENARIDPFLSRATLAIAGCIRAGDGSLDAAALALSMTRRRLQRQLSERGASFQELVDRARHAITTELLSEGRSASEIARRLGFADSAALYRAYRRWTGRTLREARERTAA